MQGKRKEIIIIIKSIEPHDAKNIIRMDAFMHPAEPKVNKRCCPDSH